MKYIKSPIFVKTQLKTAINRLKYSEFYFTNTLAT